MKKRIAPSKKTLRKKKSQSRLLVYTLVGFCMLFLCIIGFHYRNGLAYYLGFKSDKVSENNEEKQFSDVRNYQLLRKYSDKVAGIDVSEYQGKINWEEVDTVEDHFPVRFVFIRATVGKDKN